VRHKLKEAGRFISNQVGTSAMPVTNRISELVFDTELLGIGRFRCPADHRAWIEENCIGNSPLIVFPRVPVGIKHSSRHEVVADPNCVMYYNSQQMYWRRLFHDRGDHCEYFRIDPTLLTDIVSEYSPASGDAPDHPFQFCNGPSDPASYLAQRQIFDYITRTEVPDELYVQETMIRVLRRVVAMAYQARGFKSPTRKRPATDRAHRDAVEAAKAYLVARVDNPIRLNDVARAVHLSPFHLCRVFRRLTGLSLHQYSSQLRLRSSLELMANGNPDLTSLALRLGFSSHSHFTSSFTRTFNVPPSRLRN
jgi:AraC family transcriptional regulator